MVQPKVVDGTPLNIMNWQDYVPERVYSVGKVMVTLALAETISEL